RWGDSTSQFSRPVHWIVAIQGDSILPVELFEVKAGNHTFGHRFHAPEAITLNSADAYESALTEAKVVCCFEARKAQIRIQVEEAASKINAVAVVDEDLLEEVACLVEWPVALMGKFDDEFLSVPAEALISSMAEHQKYFHLIDNDGSLLPRFITISNIESSKPESVIEGNEKVIRPRLADAKFFYDTDSKKKLESYVDKLKTIVFQNKLGTLFDKTERVRDLSKVIAHSLGFDQDLADRAAQLCKCDLMTDMVYEFPDLQGIMGRYYATNDNEPSDVAAAMDEIYMPRFAGDELPSTETGLVLALAERLDTLVGIFGIGQIPTGAKDPFALRRAALGVIRLISEKQLELDLATLIESAISAYQGIELEANTQEKLLEFFAARELALYQSLGTPTQVINSVQSLKVTQPTDFKARIDAVESFNKTDGSADLAEANKRVKNILEKSDFDPKSIAINESLFESEETSLFVKINSVESFVESQVNEGNYQKALDELAGLKDVVNNFFDKVMINAEDPQIRNNRLALITKLRNLFLGIADISLLQK
ncbi:MAG: glycine--tRNA ligase subunit beta, partial [Kangiellaceae bacterium]|nr:glycine--tRNA ligase subunit beta [Kangiellaceae bacterium]